jgi:hypothetical protein
VKVYESVKDTHMDIIIKLIAFLAACRLASSESSSKERSGVKSEKLQRQRERLERKGKTLISSTERSSHKGILTMNELIQRALNASDVLMLPLNTQETTFQRCIDSSKKKVQDSSSNCSEPYCSPTQTQPVDTSVECIEFILPRCCENLYPKPVPRKLTISEAAQRKENLDWVFELVTHFPKVIVSIHYKCAWCFPDDLFGTLNSKDRRTFAMQRNYRSNSSAVVPFCSSEWSEQLRSYACPSRAQRIREVASFDDESTGNTKETGAFLRHAMNRRAEGYADFSVFVHASPAPHLGTGLFFTRFLLWAHSALASTADVPFLQINYRYKDWPPRKNVDCAWNTIFPESPWDDRIYDVSLTAAAQFVVNRPTILLRDPAVYERVLGLPACRDCKSVRNGSQLMSSCSIRFNADWSQSANYASTIEQLWGFIFPVAIKIGKQEGAPDAGEKTGKLPNVDRFGVPSSVKDPRLTKFLRSYEELRR